MMIPVEGWDMPKGWGCSCGELRYEFSRGKASLVVNPHKKPNSILFRDWLEGQYARIMEIQA
ncbi:hypothetical protein HY622_01270 [Candidatus Uhrbacteria bacterium]|nr:hypothetical protein [Candidatus Uhrbacteria bacterium]